MILEGEINDAKMSSFSSDFQNLMEHLFPSYFLYEKKKQGSQHSQEVS